MTKGLWRHVAIVLLICVKDVLTDWKFKAGSWTTGKRSEKNLERIWKESEKNLERISNESQTNLKEWFQDWREMLLQGSRRIPKRKRAARRSRVPAWRRFWTGVGVNRQFRICSGSRKRMALGALFHAASLENICWESWKVWFLKR